MAVHMVIRVNTMPAVYGKDQRYAKPVKTHPARYFFLLGESSAFRSPSVYCMPASRCAAMFGIA